jgi:thioredoxin-dependent peroxiredoxin
VRLSGLRGRDVVLYFYPKASTPGCTIEANEFRLAMPEFDQRHAVVLGISPDSPKAQAGFKAKQCLPFQLLADQDKAVAQAYGVWQEKTMYGKKVMGIVRTTFLIGADGAIRRVWPKVKPAGHAAEVLAAL